MGRKKECREKDGYYRVTEWLPEKTAKRVITRFIEKNWGFLNVVKKEIPRSVILTKVNERSGEKFKAVFRPSGDFELLKEDQGD